MPGRIARASTSWAGAAACALLTAVLVLALRALGAMESLELAVYDLQLRAGATAAETPPVALVVVTDDDIAALGNEWPLSDATLARLAGAILEHEPAAVGLDIFRDAPVAPGTERLREVLLSDPRTIAATSFGVGDSPAIAPPAPLRGTDRAGFVDVVLDADGVVRRGLLFLDDGRRLELALALRLALVALASRDIAPQPDPRQPTHMRLGGVTVPPLRPRFGGYAGVDTGGYQFLIDYRDPLRAFPTYRVSQLLSGLPADALRDRVVLVGVAAASVKDHFLTPLTRGAGAHLLMPGVELHARMVSQILRWANERARPLRALGELAEASWIVAWSVLGAVAGYRVRSWPMAVVAGAGCILVLLAVGRSAFAFGWWLPLVPCLAGGALAAGLVAFQVGAVERRQRGELMRLFARHMSPALADLIWSERDQLLSGDRPRAQRLIATVLFSDIRGYTSVAEGFAPDRLMAWLNEYMDAMAPHVESHGGVVLRFFGDAVLAAFGVPVPRTSDAEIASDARNAVECALAMRATLATLNAGWEHRGMPPVATRIGIHTGEMVGGSLGSVDRLEYTVQGDAVNTAQRLESLDKDGFAASAEEWPCRILVGEPTVTLLGDAYRFEAMGALQLRGKAKAVRVFRLVGRTDAAA